MLKILAAAAALSVMSGGALAATDTVDYSTGSWGTITFGTDNSSANYFIPPSTSPDASPYYRRGGEDWGWQHGGLTDATLANEITLFISNYDVDNPCGSGLSGPGSGCEIDNIYAYDAFSTTWLLLGAMTGLNNAYSFSEFVLPTALYDDVEDGLKVWMDIDAEGAGWIVTLAKSVIALDGADPGDPNPGVVPLPAGAWLMLSALGAGALVARRKKA